jgi:1-acyl-sn-glycerol-3-phosphate acyltransferase
MVAVFDLQTRDDCAAPGKAYALLTVVHFWMRLPGFHDVNSLDNRDPMVLERFADIAGPILWKWFRPRVRGLDKIPDGGALYVGNHSGGFMTPDTWILAVALTRERGTDDVPYALAHQVVMEAPLTNRMLPAMGAIAANPENAHRVFAAGRKVLVYPGGDLDAFRPSRDRGRVIFGPRRGYVRLALHEGVPIIPVVSAGSHDVWWVVSDGRWLSRLLRTHRFLRTDVLPITVSVPWGLTVGAPPFVPLPVPIFIDVLEPIYFDRAGPAAADDPSYVEECHQRVLDAMQLALDRLTQERRLTRQARLRAGLHRATRLFSRTPRA